MATPGRVFRDTSDSARVTAILYNFDVNRHDLKNEHGNWLRTNVVPLLRYGGSVTLIGLASTSGSEGANNALSQRRIDAALAFLKKETGKDFKVGMQVAAGEAFARAMGARPNTEDERWRAVAITAWVRPSPPPPPPSPPPPPPPPPKPPTIAGCQVIDIPPMVTNHTILFLLDQLDIRLPSKARCLAQSEIDEAWKVYGDSLAYDDIYVSDAVGAQGRPVTTALPVGNNRWIVALNMGPSAYRVPLWSPVTLIHELAHAWQSQHHPDKPYQYMINCVKSQALAEAETVRNNVWVSGVIDAFGRQMGVSGLGGNGLGDADAYSYVPGKNFGDYGGEQLAQQVEDAYNMHFRMEPHARSWAGWVSRHMKLVPRGVKDPENVRALENPKVEYKDRRGVVWH